MHFVGVDLAWGERKPTGLAVLDDDGHLVHVSAATPTTRSSTALAPYVEGDCLVAIDAPLIVTNATGNRPAEAALNKDFARFDAGAHPSNTGKPEFRDQPRGARIAARLGLDMNPRSGRSRRAIEVYPHPATVALFRLGRTLKYKNKPGRDLEQLRAELIVLLGLLEGLADAPTRRSWSTATRRPAAAPPWQALRVAVETAVRKSELRVVEDQVDAVICAYVALFATARAGADHDVRRLRDRLHRHPDAARRPAADARAGRGSPRSSATPAAPRSASTPSCSRRCGWRPTSSCALVTSILDDAGINYLSVTGRAKSVASFAAKAARTVDGTAARSPTRCARSPTRSASG